MLKQPACEKISKFFVYCKIITKNLRDLFYFFDHIFILYYAIPYTNQDNKFQKNPSMLAESRVNTNVHRFHSNSLTGGHFEFPILTKLYPYGISLYLAIFSSNMKTTGFILWSLWWSTGNIVIFHLESVPAGDHLEFPIFTKLLQRLPLPYKYPVPNLKRIRQHLQL